MKRQNTIMMLITLIIFLSMIVVATYAYFATGILNVSNVANLNIVTERNNMVFDTLGGEISLNVTAANMAESLSGNVAAENNTTLTINFTPNTEYSMVCTYDIVYEWTSSDKYMAHTSGVSSNEFTIQGNPASNSHVIGGSNSISSEKDLSSFTYTSNSTTVVSGAKIDGIGNIMSTAVWTLSSKFYNVSQDQSALSGKTYTGRFKVTNVTCVDGTIASELPVIAYWFAKDGEHVFPSYSGTIQTTGLATGHNVYLSQNSTDYLACSTIEGNEICLSQRFVNLSSIKTHTAGIDFTSTEQYNLYLELEDTFFDAGIDFVSCHQSSSAVDCYINNLSCGIDKYKNTFCTDSTEGVTCKVYNSTNAECIDVN